MKHEVNNKEKKCVKTTNTWSLNKVILKNEWINQDHEKEI